MSISERRVVFVRAERSYEVRFLNRFYTGKKRLDLHHFTQGVSTVIHFIQIHMRKQSQKNY